VALWFGAPRPVLANSTHIARVCYADTMALFLSGLVEI
jgi:hypothetical protein